MRQTLSISIPPTLKKEIDHMLDSGMYGSTSELIREALRDFKQKSLIRDLKKSQLLSRRGGVKKLTSLKSLR